MPQNTTTKTPRGPLLYTCKDAAAMLGNLNVATVYAMCDQKILDSRYQGRRRYVTAASLDAYVASLSDTPDETP